MNVDPRGLTVQEWTAFSTPSLSRLTHVPVLHAEKDWWRWAMTIIQAPRVSAHSPPDPRYFKDWREWAFRFNQVVPL